MTSSNNNASNSQPKLVLASQSPQRKQLLMQLGYQPVSGSVPVDETPLTNETPQQLVGRLAADKAKACRLHAHIPDVSVEQSVVLAADTVIDLDGQSLGKPRDAEHAVAMLLALSEREHQVHTGMCVLQKGSAVEHIETVSSTVRFARIDQALAHRYWLSGEPAGKAGSYAIQGLGAQFVVHLSGSYSNVVGLPLYEASGLLSKAGLVSF